MKSIFYCTVLFLTISSLVKAQSPVLGEANIFTYDLSGNRIVRTYNSNTTINYKQGSNQPIDTVVEKLQNDQILVRAYPNPVDELLTVENLSWKERDVAVLQLLDITGKLISTKQISKAKDSIPFGYVTPSTYLLNYYLNGKMLTSWKIIKQ